MREILFRGKKTDNGEWVEGGIIQIEGYTAIIIYSDYHDWHDFVEVIPETIGQYTGLTDKNGKKIFEGDIGRYKQTDGAKCGSKPIICTGKVVYNPKTCGFAVDSIDELGAKNYDYFPIKNFEIIGNIHDNPELLKGGDE